MPSPLISNGSRKCPVRFYVATRAMRFHYVSTKFMSGRKCFSKTVPREKHFSVKFRALCSYFYFIYLFEWIFHEILIFFSKMKNNFRRRIQIDQSDEIKINEILDSVKLSHFWIRKRFATNTSRFSQISQQTRFQSFVKKKMYSLRPSDVKMDWLLSCL